MNQLFHIFQINTEEAARLSASPDQPHSHDYEELIIAKAGGVLHFIDFKNHEIEAPAIVFVSKGKLHRLIPVVIHEQFQAWVIRFKSEFIPETTFQLYAYFHDHAHIHLNEHSNFSRLTGICEMMSEEMKLLEPDYSVLKHLLSALFAMIESERNKQTHAINYSSGTAQITFRNFLQILEQNFRRTEGVDFYAEKLLMSGRNLNLICRQIMNMSVSELIETRKLIEAKNLLIHTDMGIGEIGFELGYQDKSYFASVFKRKSGQTPTEFREDMKKQLNLSS